MNENSFVKRMNWIATGDSVLREMPLPLDAFRVTANGLPIGSGTAPTSVVNGVSFDDNETSIFSFLVPMDYDQDGDRMVLKVVSVPDAAAGTTDVGILAGQTIWRAGAAADATAGTAKAETATTTTGTLTRETFLSMSSGAGGYEPGDVLRRTLDVNASSTAEQVLLAASIIYGSCVSAYNDDDRYRDMSASTA